MTVDNIKAAILDCITERDWVSFVELDRIPGVREEYKAKMMELFHAEFDNIILWFGLSKSAVDAILALQREKKIHWEATSSTFVYMLDGAIPNLPKAKRAMNYTKPHWLPVLYRPGPTPEALLKAYDRRKNKQSLQRKVTA